MRMAVKPAIDGVRILSDEMAEVDEGSVAPFRRSSLYNVPDFTTAAVIGREGGTEAGTEGGKGDG